MDNNIHSLSQNFIAGLAWGKHLHCFKLKSQRTELPRLATKHLSSYSSNDISKLNCYSRLFYCDTVSAQHLPQRPAFSPTVQRHEARLTAILTMWCQRRVRSGWVG